MIGYDGWVFLCLDGKRHGISAGGVPPSGARDGDQTDQVTAGIACKGERGPATEWRGPRKKMNQRGAALWFMGDRRSCPGSGKEAYLCYIIAWLRPSVKRLSPIFPQVASTEFRSAVSMSGA